MKVYIVGTGVNGGSSLTREAENAIASARLIIGAERMTKPYAGTGKIVENACLARDIADIINNSLCDSAAVLMSGDCGFFSGAKKLLPLLEDHEVAVVSGISSMAYFCGKIGVSYENMRFVSLHGRQGNIAVNVRMNEKCFFLLGGDMTASDVCRRLCEYGMADVKVHTGENLGYENERTTSCTAKELCEISADKLCVLVTENPNCLRYIPSAVNDEEFVRGKVPMTKSAVRGNIVSSLEIASDSVCWDIGCGTGSVTVEMAFRCPEGMVYGFDKNSEAVELTTENARIFGCDNIKASEGMCPDILRDAPAPDKVFIGGSSGNMDDIFKCVHDKNPHADIVVSAVSLETLRQARDAFESFGCEYGIIQLAVTETRKIGNHTMLNAQNPIFILKGKLQ